MWSRSCEGLLSKTHFCRHDNNNWYSKQGQNQNNRKTGRLKNKTEKKNPFPYFSFFLLSVSKPLQSAVQGSDLLLVCLCFRCPLSRLISAVKKRNSLHLRPCETEHNEQTFPHSTSSHSCHSLFEMAIGRSGTCSCSCAFCRCTGALGSDVPSIPSKAREDRKTECSGEK